MLRRERPAVHLVREHDILAKRLIDGEAPLVALLDSALDSAVEPGEEDLDGALPHTRLLEQRPQRRPGPAGCSDRLEQPRLAHWPRIELGAAVPGALHRHGQLDTRPLLELRQPERELPLPAHREAPAGRVDVGHVVVD